MNYRPLAILIALVFAACGRSYMDTPEIAAERKAMEADGWTFVEVVGDDVRSKTKDREIRKSDPAGALTVYAASSGIDGHGLSDKEWEKRYQEEGHEFLEVKIMTSPSDCYSIVFRRKSP